MALISDGAATYQSSTQLEVKQTFHFVPDAFEPSKTTIAELYMQWGRCLALVDHVVYDTYGARLRRYFKAHNIKLTMQRTCVTEEGKDIEKALEICGWLRDFELVRREPPLVIGGGLVTDVIGFACAIYRRSTRYNRVPTTLIGLIDASVSNRVAVNWEGLKNRIGGYHEPENTIFDPSFLKTLDESEMRNGVAEILKITSCTHQKTFNLLEEHGPQLIKTCFAQSEEYRDTNLFRVADRIIRQAIQSVLDVELPNSREQILDRVMYFGHTWSPVLELAINPPLMHGHAISVDMCFSATLARHMGLLSEQVHNRFLEVFSSSCLALDHPAFTLDLLRKATSSTIATRDGHLRAPVPTGELGTHKILRDVDLGTLETAWVIHKKICTSYARKGLGIQMTVDARHQGVAITNGINKVEA
ncbi:3-dehydroquinate synthase [Xylaria scruposa]|nr:3-dehydroquinate synthase [Xylaria scruposa]